MIQDLIHEACAELELPVPEKTPQKTFVFKVNSEIEFTLKDLEPGPTEGSMRPGSRTRWAATELSRFAALRGMNLL